MEGFYNGKVVLITGGTDGIGKEALRMLLEEGARVVTCGRNSDKVYGIQKEFSQYPLLAMVTDVSNENDCRRLIEAALKTFGKIDILINNAGISIRALFKETNIDTIKKVMDVNFFGSIYCTKYALPAIIESKGIIAGISSIAGYRGFPGRSIYSASKFALQGWLEGLKIEMQEEGVHVLWISPGSIATNIRYNALSKDGTPLGESQADEANLMTATECARQILKAIKNRKRSLVLTFEAKQAILVNRLFPALADKIIRKKFFKNGKLSH